MTPSKLCIHHVGKSGRSSSGRRTEKGPSSSHFPRVVPKNVLTIGQLHSSPMLVRSCLKSCSLGFSIMQTKNFQMFKLDLGKEEEPKIKLPTHWIIDKAREFQKNIYLCLIDYAKPFDCMNHNKLWKAFKEMGIPDHIICLLRNPYAGQEAIVRTLYGTTDWFKIEKRVQQGCLLLPFV